MSAKQEVSKEHFWNKIGETPSNTQAQDIADTIKKALGWNRFKNIACTIVAIVLLIAVILATATQLYLKNVTSQNMIWRVLFCILVGYGIKVYTSKNKEMKRFIEGIESRHFKMCEGTLIKDTSDENILTTLQFVDKSGDTLMGCDFAYKKKCENLQVKLCMMDEVWMYASRVYYPGVFVVSEKMVVFSN